MDMLEQTIADLSAIQERLTAGVIFFGEFSESNSAENLFKNIRHFGHEPNDLVVLSVTPDGDGTVIGRFMKNDGSIYWFDFDLFDCNHSIITKIEARKTTGETESLGASEFLEEAAARHLIGQRGHTRI